MGEATISRETAQAYQRVVNTLMDMGDSKAVDYLNEVVKKAYDDGFHARLAAKEAWERGLEEDMVTVSPREVDLHNLGVLLDGLKGQDADEDRSHPRRFDAVLAPSHYAAGRIEAKDAMASMLSAADPEYLTPIIYYWWGCAFKYLWRWTNKGGTLDLRKAKQCIDFMLEEYNGELG